MTYDQGRALPLRSPGRDRPTDAVMARLGLSLCVWWALYGGKCIAAARRVDIHIYYAMGESVLDWEYWYRDGALAVFTRSCL